jgi:hypothetical protein
MKNQSKLENIVNCARKKDASGVREAVHSVLRDKIALRISELKRNVAQNLFGKPSLTEDVISDLKSISETHKTSQVKFKDGSSMDVDSISAGALVQVYEAFKSEKNRGVFVEKVSSGKGGFLKMLEFAFSSVKN